jgi:hypothetical protein
MASRRSTPSLETLGMGLVLLAVVSIPSALVISNWVEMRQARVAWAITGPPCPQLALGTPIFTARRQPQEFDYGGVHYARQYGHVSCVGFREDGVFNRAVYRVCQFSGPMTLAITSGRDQLAFRPGVGRRATVVTRGGKTSCVVGGWFSS